jgi:hypothetical protein
MTEDNRDPEPVRGTDRTTIIRGSGDRGGSGVAIVLLVIVVLLVILFFLFRGNFGGATHDARINVAAPNVKVPDINVKVPDVKVTVPKIDVKTEDRTAGNSTAGK